MNAVLLMLASNALGQSNDDLLPPPGGYDQPMVHMGQSVYGQLMADRLEYQRGQSDPLIVVDLEGWLGTDRRRFRYRVEGEHGLPGSEGGGEVSLLYGHLFAPFWEVQAGARFSGERSNDANDGSVAAFVGLEGAIPYDFDFETGLYVDYQSRVSWSATVVKEFMFAQRVVLQLRAETGIGSAERGQTGSVWQFDGLGTGIRLRFEMHRQFAPYIGYTHALGADLASQSVQVSSTSRAVGGIRIWF